MASSGFALSDLAPRGFRKGRCLPVEGGRDRNNLSKLAPIPPRMLLDPFLIVLGPSQAQGGHLGPGPRGKPNLVQVLVAI